MFKSLFFSALVATGFAAAFAAPQTAAASDQQPGKAAPAKHSADKPGDRNCIRDTGSRIPTKKGGCLPVAGRSYSKHDIDATGETTIGPALQKLDPAITLHGGGH